MADAGAIYLRAMKGGAMVAARTPAPDRDEQALVAVAALLAER